MRRLNTFLRAQSGGVSVLTALSSVALIGFAGLATDVGAVYLETRRLQGSADLAALSAMQNPARAEALAGATITANGWPRGTQVRVVRGAYASDRAVRPDQRFRPNAAGANAVRVQVTSSAPLFFGRLFIPEGRMRIVRTATAAQTRLASFQIGSRLLSLRGGVANQLLTGLTGSSVNLSVMDYNALLSADVDLLSYVDALHTRLDLEGASYERTLAHDVELPDALSALADVVEDGRAEDALRSIAQAAERANETIGLDEVIDLGPYGAQDHATRSSTTAIQVNAMDMATALLQIADGDRQVRLQLGADVPGLTSTNVWLAIGERPNNSPWLAVTDDDDVVIRTAQTRLYVESNVSVAGLANVRVPVLVELAAAQARLERIDCGFDARQREVTLAVSPSLGSISMGEVDTSRLDNFRSELRPAPAQLVRTALARVEGEARIQVGGESWTDVRFTGAEIDRGVVKSVATRDAAQATISSLLGRTQLTVRVLGLGLNTGTLTSLVRSALTAAAGPLDGLINGLSDLLGIRLGEADVRVNGVRCGGAALVA